MENELIARVRSNPHSEIRKLYDLYRQQFFLYATSRFALDQDIISDIYQDSFVALYENIQTGRLSKLNCSLKTYLFKIATNKIHTHLAATQKYKKVSIEENWKDAHDQYSTDEWKERQDVVFKAVSEMEHLCRTMLSMFYWEQRKISEIAREMGYKSEQVVKNRKKICLQRLKEKIIEWFIKEDLS